MDIMNAVMVILEEEENWESARKQMLSLGFLSRLRKIESITAKMKQKLKKYTRKTNFKCKNAAVYSCGAAFLCDWVLMLEDNEKPVLKKEIDP